MVFNLRPAEPARLSRNVQSSRATQPKRQKGKRPPLMTSACDWRGQSGRIYRHTVYTLLSCPALTAANYLLVYRRADGTRILLAADYTVGVCGSENLAHLRHEAALRGANEIHILDGELSDEAARLDRQQIAQDVRSGQFNALIRELKTSVANLA